MVHSTPCTASSSQFVFVQAGEAAGREAAARACAWRRQGWGTSLRCLSGGVVSLLPGPTEALFALGLGSRSAGSAHASLTASGSTEVHDKQQGHYQPPVWPHRDPLCMRSQRSYEGCHCGPADASTALHDHCSCSKQQCWALMRIQHHHVQPQMPLLRCSAACLGMCMSSAARLPGP